MSVDVVCPAQYQPNFSSLYAFIFSLFRRMENGGLYTFSAALDIIGINPFVFLPAEVLNALLAAAGKQKGNVPVKGTVNGHTYRQTLVRYRSEWRLYINQNMLKGSPKRIGETLSVTICVDEESRAIEAHPKLLFALQQNEEAKAVFDRLRPSLQHEIIRYITLLKSEKSVDKNVSRALSFLLGKTNFIGRQKPG